jgi:Fe-S-cluster containining protein
LKPAKCCAFQPFVPNFLLGAWLENSAVLPEIANVQFHPVGAVPSPDYRNRHEAVTSSGGDPGVEFLCGFFDRERRACSIWSVRPGECSTYFCDDLRFNENRQALRNLSFDLESNAAQMALVELGYTPKQISEQVDLVNGVCSVQIYPGQEILLMYKKAWKWSQGLSREMIESWT